MILIFIMFCCGLVRRAFHLQTIEANKPKQKQKQILSSHSKFIPKHTANFAERFYFVRLHLILIGGPLMEIETKIKKHMQGLQKSRYNELTELTTKRKQH